jgi:two-component system, NarL family, sensor histidine kinase DesK
VSIQLDESPSRPEGEAGRSPRRVSAGVSLPWLRSQPRFKTRFGAAVVWLAFIVFPLIDAIQNRGPEATHLAAIAGTAVFVAIYVWLVLISFAEQPPLLPFVLVAILVLDAGALTLVDRPGWAFLFTYCAACMVLVAPPSMTFAAVLGCSAAAVGGSVLGGATSTAVGAGATTLGVGLLMVLMRDLRTRNLELMEARAELADVAVAAERERFARDLHDLLGHTLSVVALKAELAGRLLPDQPEQAAVEMGEVETVARQALREVRQAVSGYHQPTLDGELAGARMALSTAGIEADVERAAVTFAPEVEAVLAWAVREGATNVIRHSHARRCTLRISAHLGSAAVEVVDDGPGGLAGGGGGHGLAGLAERAQALRGDVEAGPAAAGGFRLAVSVPVTAGQT